MADQHTIDGRQVEAKRALPRDKTPNMSSGRYVLVDNTSLILMRT